MARSQVRSSTKFTTFLPASLPIDRNTRLSLFVLSSVCRRCGHKGICDAPDQIQESVRLCAFFMSPDDTFSGLLTREKMAEALTTAELLVSPAICAP